MAATSRVGSTLPVALSTDNVDPEMLARPRKWDIAGIAKFMLVLGPVSSVFDLLAFWMMWSLFGANTVALQALFQSGWFVGLAALLVGYMVLATVVKRVYIARYGWQ